MTPGVYLLTHRTTGDTYVGKALELRSRIQGHLALLAKAQHECRSLNELAKTHGCDFGVTILEHTDRDGRRAAELKWIKAIRPTLNQNDVLAHGITPRSPRKNAANGTRKVSVGGKIERELFDELEAIAKADERTISFMVEKAVRLLVESVRGKQAGKKR